MLGFNSPAKASKSDCADANCVEVEGVLGVVNAAAVATVARRMVAVVFMVEYSVYKYCVVSMGLLPAERRGEKENGGIQTRSGNSRTPWNKRGENVSKKPNTTYRKRETSKIPRSTTCKHLAIFHLELQSRAQDGVLAVE